MNVSFKKNVLSAFGAQGVFLASKFVTVLILPRFLPVGEYAYWQLFLFYASYAEYAHIGIIDGVYLRCGGQRRGEVDKAMVCSALVSMLCVVIGVATLVAAYGLLFEEDQGRRSVLLAVAIYAIVFSVYSFISRLLQSVNETRLSSRSVVVAQGCFIVSLVMLLFLRVDDSFAYVVCYVACYAIALAFLLWVARDLLQGFGFRRELMPKYLSSILPSGFVLMSAGFFGVLIIGSARWIVDAFWGLEVFTYVSFAITMINFFMSFVYQAGMVLFPALRGVGESRARGIYSKALVGASLLFPFLYLAYYPLAWLINLWLPQYFVSTIFLIYLMPLCLFDGKMNLLFATYLKVFNKERSLLVLNVLAVALSVCLGLLSVCANCLEAVFVAIDIAVVARSIGAQIYISRSMGFPCGAKGTVVELIFSIVFVAVNVGFPSQMAFVWTAVFCMLLFLVRRNDLRSCVGD